MRSNLFPYSDYDEQDYLLWVTVENHESGNINHFTPTLFLGSALFFTKSTKIFYVQRFKIIYIFVIFATIMIIKVVSLIFIRTFLVVFLNLLVGGRNAKKIRSTKF